MKDYRGKYRVLIERDENGDPLEDGFTYLKCNGKNMQKIYRYDENTLVCYVIGTVKINRLVTELTEKGIKVEVEYYDGEADIKFAEEDLDKVASIFKVNTIGAGIHWNSIKNHPRKKEIREEKLANMTDEEREIMRLRGEKLRASMDTKG